MHCSAVAAAVAASSVHQRKLRDGATRLEDVQYGAVAGAAAEVAVGSGLGCLERGLAAAAAARTALACSRGSEAGRGYLLASKH